MASAGLAQNGTFWCLAFNTNTQKLQEFTIVIYCSSVTQSIKNQIVSGRAGLAMEKTLKGGENWRQNGVKM